MLINDTKSAYNIEKKPTIVTDYSSKKPTKIEQKEAQNSLMLLKSKMRSTLKQTTTLEERDLSRNETKDTGVRGMGTTAQRKPATEQNIGVRGKVTQPSLTKIEEPMSKRPGQAMAETRAPVSKPVYGQVKPPAKTTTTTNYTSEARNNGGARGGFDEEDYSVNKYIGNNPPSTKQSMTSTKRTVKEPFKEPVKQPAKYDPKGYGRTAYEEDEYDIPKPNSNTMAKRPNPVVEKKVESKPPARQVNRHIAQSEDENNYEELPVRQARGNFDIPSEPEEEIVLVKCSEGCGKSFRPDVAKKHAKICKKVFQQKRKVFNMAEQRQPDELKEFEAESKYRKKQTTKQPAKPKAKEGAIPKWKMQSAMLRNGIRAGKGDDQSHTEEAIIAKKFEETQMTRCQFCNRTFNDEAAKRHIPFCEKKTKDAKLKGGPAKKPAPVPVKKR